MSAIDISVIVPCYNEERYITSLLDAIYTQTIALERVEVIIADGLSSDQTRKKVSDFQENHPKLSVLLIDNPKRNIPSALNLAIRSAQGEYIIRLDAHSIPEQNYLELCIRHLDEEVAQNIGGVWNIQPGENSTIAAAIAVAAAHPLGVGGAKYRNTNATAGYVDTVPFGAYRKEFLHEIGLYDETLLSNEDYELNTRIRKAGGKIYLDPKIRCTYFSRTDLKSLAKQYYRYGFWKFLMLRDYPFSIKPRQFLPPTLIVVISILLLVSLIYPPGLIFLIVFIGIYTFSLFFGTYLVTNTTKNAIAFHFLITASIITMHIAWGTGFLSSALKTIFRLQNHAKNVRK